MTPLRRSDINYTLAATFASPETPVADSKPAGPTTPLSHGPAGPLSRRISINDSSPTSVRLDRNLREALKQLAKERRWSMSVLIQQVLEAFVKAEDKKKK